MVAQKKTTTTKIADAASPSTATCPSRSSAPGKAFLDILGFDQPQGTKQSGIHFELSLVDRSLLSSFIDKCNINTELHSTTTILSSIQVGNGPQKKALSLESFSTAMKEAIHKNTNLKLALSFYSCDARRPNKAIGLGNHTMSISPDKLRATNALFILGIRGLRADVPFGITDPTCARITQLQSGSPLERIGFREEDEINRAYDCNGKEYTINSSKDLLDFVSQNLGRTASFSVTHQNEGKEHHFSVRIPRS